MLDGADIVELGHLGMSGAEIGAHEKVKQPRTSPD